MTQTLRRTRAYGCTCALCGAAKQTLGGRWYSWRWRVENPDGCAFVDGETFCSGMCRKAFRG